MKKIIFSFIISFIIFTMNVYCFAATATVNATAVRMREAPSTDSNIVTNLYKEDEVEILEENGEWYKVKYGENVGYAKAEFFLKKTEKPENTVPEEPTVTQVPEEQSLVPNEENSENINQELNIGETITLSSTVKLRVMPNLATNAKMEIEQGTKVSVEAKLGNWCKITSETLSGWVTKSKLTASPVAEPTPATTQEPVQTEPEVPQTSQNTTPTENIVPDQTAEKPVSNKTAIVIVETARVRKKASTNAEIVDVLDEDDIVTITGEEGNFYQITSSKIGSGYISKSLVRERDITSRSATEERENTTTNEKNDMENQAVSQETSLSVTGNDVVAFAKQFLGYPYVLGASSPEKGFDCSGFTRYVFGHFGYTLGQVAASQTTLGSVVERANLQVGDLLLFYDDGKTKIGHCGIFIGGGDFIHSANPQRGVVIDNLNSNSYYSQRFVTARRIAE